LVQRGADSTLAMHDAQRGLAGDFEDESVWDAETRSNTLLDRQMYREIIELLQDLGIVMYGSQPPP
jgi:hypothetical protein